MQTTPPPDEWGFIVWVILGLVATVGSLTVALKVLYSQILKLQKEKDDQSAKAQENFIHIVGEVQAMLAQVSERLRVDADIMVEVQNVIKDCRRRGNVER